MFLSSASGICGECWLHIRLITTSHARTWRWRRMRRYGELSRGADRSSPRQFSPDCTIAMCGYDFREGQGWTCVLQRPSIPHTRGWTDGRGWTGDGRTMDGGDGHSEAQTPSRNWQKNYAQFSSQPAKSGGWEWS